MAFDSDQESSGAHGDAYAQTLVPVICGGVTRQDWLFAVQQHLIKLPDMHVSRSSVLYS
jgi:hypothetical protein